VQHELRRNMLLDVAYVGQPRRRPAALRQLQPGRAEQRRRDDRAGRSPPDRGFADITYAFNGGKSRYKALQTKFEWRVSRDVTC
jgi:hypothetical protein